MQTNKTATTLLAMLLSASLLAGCGSSTNEQQTDTAASASDNTATDTSGDATTTPDNADEWVINDTQQRSSTIMENSSSLGVLVNVQSVTSESIDGKTYTVVASEGIPDYTITIDQATYDWLNARPNAASDFVSGQTTANVGDSVAFGEDIGYASNNSCETNAGYGYWPPGPVCPTAYTREGYFPDEPSETDTECSSGLGEVGLWVNGTSVYNWSDGQSYNNGGTWHNLAPIAEQYDVDLCGGHAAQGDYHHHFYSSCLADMVGDDGSAHSPLYGYAADGYPIYGPWEAAGELARSAWATRNYTAGTDTGCSDGKRSCVMVDQYDSSKGTETASSGPGFSQVVSTLSGNQLQAYNGYFFEDYFWDSTLTAQGGAFLDQYNGHSDATRGYHYHITVTEQDGKLAPAFPYIIGERFAGKLESNALTQCSTGIGGPGMRG